MEDDDSISIHGLIDNFKTASGKTIGTAIGLGLGAGAIIGTGLIVAHSVKKKNKSRTSKGRARDRKFVSKQKWERRYKRKKPGKHYRKRKSKRPKRLVKGSKAAKAYMAKLRRMRK